MSEECLKLASYGLYSFCYSSLQSYLQDADLPSIHKSVLFGSRLRRCIATINRWTDYCNNREIIVVIILDVSKTSQNNRSRWFKKIITLMVITSPGRYILKIHFFIELGLKVIRLKKNPEFSFKKNIHSIESRIFNRIIH